MFGFVQILEFRSQNGKRFVALASSESGKDFPEDLPSLSMDPCMGGHGCAHICQSEHGVPRSACHPGYQLSEYKKACADVNECVEGLAPCSHRCVNTVESFTCACHPGFELGADGKQCYRIELKIVSSCEKNNGGCSCHCEHAVGGPCCSCNHGHRLDSDEKTCIDLDECESGEACRAQLCINYIGVYGCSCQEGFRIQFCYVDECLDVSIVCDQLCINSVGTYEYTCEEGCRIVSDGKTGISRSPETSGKEYDGICDCQNGGTCDPLSWQCECPSGVHGKTCEDRCPKGFFGKSCKRKCNCANNDHCHRVYGACMCEPGRYGRFFHLNCPRGAYGAGCSLECQCVEENTLECSAKNGSCTCKSGYQGNR
eukprot:XP_023979965.1 EGF-like and EMI domain-containing protein 1 [Physeter catodon]